MSPQRNDLSASDKELWQSLAIGVAEPRPVDAMDFAAWIEGRLDEAEAAPNRGVGGSRSRNATGSARYCRCPGQTFTSSA